MVTPLCLAWLVLACGRPAPDALVGIWEDDLSRSEGLNTTWSFAADGRWWERAPHWDEAPCDRREDLGRGGTWTREGDVLVLTTTWTSRVEEGRAHDVGACTLIGGYEWKVPVAPTTTRHALGPCADDWGEPDCRAVDGKPWWRRVTGDPVRGWQQLCAWCNPYGPGPVEE